jgi:simple sugar transport system ATP-binding protein
MSKLQPLVKMTGIHKYFGSLTALEDVEFTINTGETVGLVGDNGAGKSTLMKILAGVYPPDRGDIQVDGKSVRFKSPREAMNHGIEIVYQDLRLVPALSVARNIFLGRELQKGIGPFRLLDMNGMRDSTSRALDWVGLSFNVDTSVESLSGGQRQAVAIAKAMYFNPKLLILDEPTNNLSVKETQRVLDYVRKLKEQEVSAVFITHNIEVAHGISDRIVLLSHGLNAGVFMKGETTASILTKKIAFEL